MSEDVPKTSLSAVVVAFVGSLRRRGVPVSTGDTIDAARALQCVDLSDRGQVRACLRATLAKDVPSRAAFDDIFDRAFPRTGGRDQGSAESGGAEAESGQDSVDGTLTQRLLAALRQGDPAQLPDLANEAINQWGGMSGQTRGARHHRARTLRGMGLTGLLPALVPTSADASDFDRRLAVAAATAQLRGLGELVEQLVAGRLANETLQPPQEAEAVGDLSILSADSQELAAVRRAVRPLARALASRLARRRRGRGGLDMRHTIRASMASGGIPLQPIFRRRSRARPELVALCDVSGSVAQFAPFSLALLHALTQEFQHVRSWVFVDGMVEVSEILDKSRGVLDAETLLGRRGLVTGDGRSDYAAAFTAFLSQSRAALSPRTTVLVIGDARSHDRPLPTTQLAEIRRLARHVYWLNPEPAVQWDTKDSAAGLLTPHVDAMYEVATLRQLSEAVAAIA